MDKETLWILRKLSSQEISVQSADRILRALKFLKESEEDTTAVHPTTEEQIVTAEMPQEAQEIAEEPQEEESEVAEEPESAVTQEDDSLVEEIESTESYEPEKTENELEETVDAPKLIPDIADTVQAIDEAVEEWEEDAISDRVEQPQAQETHEETEEVAEYVEEMEATDAGETSEEPQEAAEPISADTVWVGATDTEPLLGDDGTCAIEDIRDGTELVLGGIRKIIIQGWHERHLRAEGDGHSSTVLWAGKLLKIDGGNENRLALYIPPAIGKISVAGGSDLVDITSFNGSLDIENIGGSLTLKNIAGNMDLKGENSAIAVEDFSGKVRVEAKNVRVCFKNSSDAELHIESDGGDIIIEDCYGDTHVSSGTGDAHVSGGELSFDVMSMIDLKIESGNAYIHGRSFQDIKIAVAEGNVELSMEELSSGGSGQLSVHKGNITVEVPPGFECELIAQGSREKMYIELPVEVAEKDKSLLHGMMSGGGPRLELLAPDGEIRLQTFAPPKTPSNMVKINSGSGL
ncbi:hypothetical protein ACFL6S_01060 [Candidatus Poribacteria bacterium]